MIGITLLIVIAAAALFFASRTKPSQNAVLIPIPSLNPAGVKFAAGLLAQDVEDGLTGRQSYLAKASAQELLLWANLDGTVTARAYEAAYDNNEISADDLYKDKRLMVAGSVLRIEKDISGNGNVWLAGSGFLGVHATLDGPGTRSAALFKPGDRVALVCRGDGRLLTVATLSHCDLLTNYLNTQSSSIQRRVEDALNGKLKLPRELARFTIVAYVSGMLLPPGSTCLDGHLENCSHELETSTNDKQKQELAKAKARELAKRLQVM